MNSVPDCELKALTKQLWGIYKTLAIYLQFTKNFYLRIKLKSSQIIASLFSNKFELVKTYLNLFKWWCNKIKLVLHHYFQTSLNLLKTLCNNTNLFELLHHWKKQKNIRANVSKTSLLSVGLQRWRLAVKNWNTMQLENDFNPISIPLLVCWCIFHGHHKKSSVL